MINFLIGSIAIFAYVFIGIFVSAVTCWVDNSNCEEQMIMLAVLWPVVLIVAAVSLGFTIITSAVIVVTMALNMLEEIGKR